MNEKKATKHDLDPFGTEIDTQYRKRLTPYIPGSREAFKRAEKEKKLPFIGKIKVKKPVVEKNNMQKP